LEQAKEKKLRHQIEACKFTAPGDGIILHATEPDPPGRRSRSTIEEGSIVRERQKLFSIIDSKGPYRVVAQIPEAMIARIRYRIPVRVRLDAFPDEVLTGVVGNVAPLPSPSTPERPDQKTYQTFVAIEKAPPGLRPGMTANAEFVLDEIDDVLI